MDMSSFLIGMQSRKWSGTECMKILHVNSYYSNRGFYKHLYERLIRDGVETTVYVPVPYSYHCDQDDKGDYTDIAPIYTQIDRLLYFSKQQKIWRDLNKRYDLREYDLIHAHSLFANGHTALKCYEALGIPYIVCVRGTDAQLFFRRMLHLRHVGIRIMLKAEIVVFLSSSYRDYVLSTYTQARYRDRIRQKSVVIPNGIDESWIENRKSRTRTKQDEIHLIATGEIKRNKNYLAAAHACEKLLEKNIRVQYTVVGPVVNKKYHKRLLRFEFVRYVPKTDRAGLINLYCSHDIFVLPSIHETFGLVYAEAMSQGLPVVYTRGEGFDGQFPDGEVGYAVDCRNPGEIAEKIVNILACYNKMSQNCTNKCKKFEWKKISDVYANLYYSIVLQR